MKYDFLNDAKYDSDYFLKLAIVARHNSIVLNDHAKLAFEHQKNRKQGLFLRYTAFEELQKAIFCMLVHRGFMNKEQIFPVFFKHDAKIILFERIFKTSGLVIEDNEFFLDKIPLKKLDFNKILEDNKDFGGEYMDKRNDCLYVRPSRDGYHSPSLREDIEEQKEKLNEEMTALNAFFEIVWLYDFKGNIDGFSYYKLTPKDKPDSHNVTFAGGELIKRENFKPDWVDEFFKELE